MSTYEERMAEKYGFFSKDDAPLNKEIDQDSTDTQEEKLAEEETTIEEVVENTGGDNLLVPIQAWENVLKQLGNLHEANQLMAESRERAAKAEAEAEFLREKLKNTRDELETTKKKRRFLFFK
jgi:polyhydroxyalkanoate synthesis regulator protein|tara:strand:- start:1085 stop:1453 length:369 start_codon:yes stop_codon:yes gene_type:complete